MAHAPVIVWLRQDLRLSDNAALSAAAACGQPVLPVYVMDDAAAGTWTAGGASRWWLGASLAALESSLARIGSGLILRRSDTVAALLNLASQTGARAIHFTRAYEPHAARLEKELKSACDAVGIGLHRYGGGLLQEPETMHTQAGQPFKVFTPFWRALLDAPGPRFPHPAPQRLRRPKQWPDGDSLDNWQLTPVKPDWAGGLRATWTPGEAGARQRLTTLVDQALHDYADGRDRPDRTATSMLSPHLHFGEVSPRQIWAEVWSASRDAGLLSPSKAATVFLSEVGWREFAHHLLFHFSHTPEQPLRGDFARFPWRSDRTGKLLRAWQQGRTGYPIVDAGMRQLWRTGWMHNRVRMVAGSFLVKHLRLPWNAGADWFWDTLVDADLASNTLGWQWTAGCGADAAPYFRVFAPVLQGQRFDPAGDYVRRWVPELARLPAEHLHAPWEAPRAVLDAAGVRLGDTYPRPIVDHATARAEALAAFQSIRGKGVIER